MNPSCTITRPVVGLLAVFSEAMKPSYKPNDDNAVDVIIDGIWRQ